MSEHDRRFRHASVVLRLGATPVLRGRFTAAAARIAQSSPGFAKFELVYDLNSTALVEQLRMHQINFAIVAEQAILNDQLSFAVSALFEDTMSWVVPASVSDDDIRAALHPVARTAKINPVLTNYIEIETIVPTRPASDDWYRNFLTQASATFTVPTFAASIELVSGGLGTCHVPDSLLPNLLMKEDGHVFLWLEALDDKNFPNGTPRAYALAYDPEMVKKVEVAMGKIKEGEDVSGTIADAASENASDTAEALAQMVKEGATPNRPNSGSVGERYFNFEPKMMTFGEAAAPITPAKDQ